jgi:hypothetical protein
VSDDVVFTRTVTLDCGLSRHLIFVDYRPLGAFIAESAIPDVGAYLRYWRGVWRRDGFLRRQPALPPGATENTKGEVNG